jgi:hypothetical protein
MSRVKKEKQLIGEDLLDITPEMKRFATPEIVARYRAERLACDTIVDLCSGFGFQAFAFAQTCKHVIAAEKDPDTVAASRKFAEKLGLKNVTFLCGDALSPAIIKKIQKADVIFCDPQRAPAEKERALATIQPNIQELLALYEKITPNIALELPPHISNTAFDAEYEYLSVDATLNRLTLYFGSLKQAEKSIVLLPENKKITGSFQKKATPVFASFAALSSSQHYSFLLEPNPALVLSGLFYEALCAAADQKKIEQSFVHKDIIQFVQEKKMYFLSTHHISSPFFVCYKILNSTSYAMSFDEKQKVKMLLQEHDALHVILKYSLDPQAYWQERTFFEKGLSGSKTLYLFAFDQALICEKISPPKTI